MDDVLILHFCNKRFPGLAVFRPLQYRMVEIIDIVFGVTSLKDGYFRNRAHAAQIQTDPVTVLLSDARCIECSGIIVEHQFGLYGGRTAE